MALNTPENASSVIQALLEIARSGRDADSLLNQVGLSDRELNLVTRSLSRTLRSLHEIAGLQNRVEETILRIQGTSGSEQRRLARQEASRNESRARSDMRYVDLLGRFGLRPNAQGDLFEVSRRDYLTQKYYSQFAEFNDEGFVSNRQEATRTARTLADAQIRQENIEANNRLQEDATRKQHARRAQNLSAVENYRDSLRSIQDPEHMRRKALYEQFLQVDEISGKSSLEQRKEAARRAKAVLSAEQANSKEVSKNTLALSKLRAFIGPYAKMAMPFYALQGLGSLLKQDVSVSQYALNRKAFESTFVGDESAAESYGSYSSFKQRYLGAGGKIESVRKAFMSEMSWASGLQTGEGVDRIRAMSRAIGVAPDSDVLNDPEALFKWYEDIIPTLDRDQRLRLSKIVDPTIIAAYSRPNYGKIGRVNILQQTAEEEFKGTSLGRHPLNWIKSGLESTFPNLFDVSSSAGMGIQGASFGGAYMSSLMDKVSANDISTTGNNTKTNNVYVTVNYEGDPIGIETRLPAKIVDAIENAEK